MTKDFSSFVRKIYSECVHYGLARIRPPPEWKPLENGSYNSKLSGYVVRRPIRQNISGQSGVYRQCNVEQRVIFNLLFPQRRWALLHQPLSSVTENPLVLFSLSLLFSLAFPTVLSYLALKPTGTFSCVTEHEIRTF